MTSSGKIRIYELSKDLGLDNKDVLDAAHKLSIAAKSHSSSISDKEAKQIRAHLKNNSTAGSTTPKAKPSSSKEILSVKKAAATSTNKSNAVAKKEASTTKPQVPQKPVSPLKPTLKPKVPNRPPTQSERPSPPPSLSEAPNIQPTS